MGEQNKILDVTYGKFSCRLEGFDDAIETMKAVVTFFHDLAGHESFMEIAPGMPDLDTLARMAEAQSGGSVTATPMGNGVSLTRTVDVEDARAADEAFEDLSALPEENDSDDAPANADDKDAMTVEDEAAPVEDTSAPLEAPDDHDDLSDNIFESTSEAADSWEDSETEAFLDTGADDAPEAETALEETGLRPLEDTAAAEAHEAFQDDTDEMVAEDVTVPFENEDDAETTAAVEEEITDEDEDEEESFTSKLDRIRAVVSRGVSSARSSVEDSPEPPTVRPGNPLAQRLAELAKRNSELMQADDRVISPLERVEADAEDDMSAEDDAPAAFDDVAEAEVETHDDWAAEPETVMEDPALHDDDDDDDDKLVLETDAPADEELSGIIDEVEDDHTEEGVLFARDDSSETDDLLEAELEDETSEEAEMTRTTATFDDESEAEEDMAENAGSDAVLQDDEDSDRPRSSPSAARPLLLTTPQRPASEDVSEDTDDDFDLSAELAEIEKEIASRPRNGMTRHGLPRRVEDAMSRIFMQTNRQLDEPEGRRHRDALAQLKAAVAATEAAEQLGDRHSSRDVGGAYRDDLGALETEGRKGSEGLPPLKLVKPEEDDDAASVPEPRITSKPLDVAAQRLRQIASTKDASEDGEKSEGFVAFLEKQGVTDLGDKLEAAAAYLAFVEGEPEFTRPQLMRLVQSASREEITREDGLRCFGRLLRQARFAKLNNGRFKVDDNTPFRPRTSRLAQG